MFERFTDRARRVIVMAQEEARLLNHNYIGTEHLLLGLLADGDGDAARTLESLDITLEAAREAVAQIVGEGNQPQRGHIPFTPRAKKVLELSLREALTLRSQSIGSVHLLLGLLAEGEGVGAQIIERLGAPLTTVRERAVELAGNEPDTALGNPVRPTSVAAGWPRPPRAGVEGFTIVAPLLAAIDRRLSRIERHLGIAEDAGEPAEKSAEKSAAQDEPAVTGEGAVSPGEPAAPEQPATGTD